MNQKRKAKIVVIEGPDRCGKATQSRLLKEYIERRGMFVKIVEVPIRSAVTYKLIYWMLQNGTAKKYPKAFQVIQFLNRKIFQKFKLPSLQRFYDVLIFDRWSLSTVVYGAATGVPVDFTLKLSDWLQKPDHTFIFIGRSFPHEAEDIYESDTNLQDNVRMLYSQWAADNPDVCTVVNSRQEKKKIAKMIRSVLADKGILPKD